MVNTDQSNHDLLMIRSGVLSGQWLATGQCALVVSIVVKKKTHVGFINGKIMNDYYIKMSFVVNC